MRVAVVTETLDGERRVAAVPETVGKLRAAGAEVAVEAGAGNGAFFTDDDYTAKGAEVVADRASLLGNADVVVSVQPLRDDDVRRLRAGASVISFLPPTAHRELVKLLAERSITSYALDLVPRISRAQSMDALSSQALVAGYRVTLAAAERLPKFFPMFMTAAGTVAPAKVLVLGTGVAGLQVIATARRLGAVVEAYDVRTAARDEVRSLGAKFVELDLEAQEGEGGYARVQSEEFLAKQRELVGRHVQAADVVITTAAVPGRKAPLLVTTPMVEAMKPGSVVVDLAAETGGNCELTQPGHDIVHGGVTIYGPRNVPSELPRHASELYSRNVVNLLLLMVKDGALAPDFDDEILAGCCLTRGGEIVHPLATGASS